MAGEAALDLINRQEWLEPLGDQVQKGVHGAFESAGPAGQKVKNALHGTWLGHPLHPVLTDIPVGAWTVALVCDAMEDMTGRKEFAQGADLAVAVGLAGAVGSAMTGIADWSDTDGRARKIGLVHGMLNLGGALLYGTSLIFRNRKKRNLGRGFGILGYAVAFGSAYLGGELVYTEQVGVNHAAGGPPLPEKFTPVIAADQLTEGEMKKVDANGVPVLLVRQNGQIHALAETCTHAGGPLSEGKLEDGAVVCPWHGSRFDLETGKVLDGPATHRAPCFETRVREGQIQVRKSS
jgi:nitrite reductase/ring-hydroxylating ferredoxin subunit/uncharacterized membrane protein